MFRIGLIGLDMSHAVEFTKRLNDPRNPEHVPGARVIAGWPGGSKDFELSWSRVDRFTKEVREDYGVQIMDSPEAVAEAVDLIFITAADGRAHRPLFERVVKFKKPTFIEKPIAINIADAREIFRLADEAHVPVMSCSTIRYCDPLWRALADDSLGEILGCDVFGPMPEEATQPGLFWYGIHCLEVINVVMRRGCREVRSYRNDDYDLLTATWADGRVATFRGMRKGAWKFGVTLHREKGFEFIDLQHNSWFSQTIKLMLENLPYGKSPIDPTDTLELIRIIEAANTSRPNGKVVELL